MAAASWFRLKAQALFMAERNSRGVGGMESLDDGQVDWALMVDISKESDLSVRGSLVYR